jgi:hypothetical protein
MTAQEKKVLALLTEHIGHWVDSRELSLIAIQYPAVIKRLREKYGHVIVNHVDRVGWKSVRGRYKLLTEREALAAKIGAGEPVTREQIERSQRDVSEPTLFDLAPFDRHRDEN